MATGAQPKLVLVQQGKGNSGKSSTIRLFHGMLMQAYPDAQESHVRRGPKELRTIITIGGVKIGIETFGDPAQTKQVESLRLFVKESCTIVITAARTRGDTIDNIHAILGSAGFNVEPRHRTPEDSQDRRAQVNRAEARWMLDRICPYLE